MTDDRWLLVASLTSLRASAFNPAVARSSVGSGLPSNSLFFSDWVVMIFPFRIPRTEVGKISMIVLQITTAGLAPFSFMARHKAVQAGISAASRAGPLAGY